MSVRLRIGSPREEWGIPLFDLCYGLSPCAEKSARVNGLLPFAGVTGGTEVSKDRVIDVVEQLAQPIAESQALELVDVEYKKEGANWILRVFIDKVDGIDIDDCSRFSEALSTRLDEVDPIPSSYFLEVSSPGAERPIKKPSDYDKAVGEYVHLSLYEPFDGHKVFEGTLLRHDDNVIELEHMEKNIARKKLIPKDKVASARFAIRF